MPGLLDRAERLDLAQRHVEAEADGVIGLKRHSTILGKLTSRLHLSHFGEGLIGTFDNLVNEIEAFYDWEDRCGAQ